LNKREKGDTSDRKNTGYLVYIPTNVVIIPVRNAKS